jgi:hypothetical protein
MKISAIASILAFVSTPLSAFAATYTCDVNAGFKLYQDDDENPTYPNTTEKDLAATTLQSSYDALEHTNTNHDFDMSGITVTDFTQTNSTRTNNNYKNLRAGNNFDAILKSTSSVACNLCGSWDDDDAAGAALETADWLAESHTRWVANFCVELNDLENIFENACSECTITLSCTLDTLRNNEDEIEVIKIHEVEAAMKNEDIEMEVDASRH